MEERQINQGKTRQYVILLYACVTVFLLVILHNLYLPYFGTYLVTENKPARSDAIFVFGGSIPNRIIEAAQLYKKGYAPLIIISKYPEAEGYNYLKDLGIRFPEGQDINKKIAIEMGVPEKDILISSHRAGSTFEELKQLYSFLNEKGYKSVILVSSKSHTRRISIISSDINHGDIKTYIKYTGFDSYNPPFWWKDRNSLRQTIFEYEKLIHYYLVDRPNIN